MSYPLKKLSEILSKEKFSIGKIKTKEYLEDGEFPVIDQGKRLVSGYSNDKKLVYTGKLPVLVYGDHTNSLKFVNFPFIAGADGIKVLSFKDSCDIKYCYYLVENFKPETQGYRRHYSFFKEIALPLPPLPTQKAIVQKLDTAFGKIDTSIELAQKNLENVEELGRSILSETSQYEKVKIGEIVKELSAGGDLPKNKSFSKEKTEEYQIPIYANAVKEDGLYGYTHTAKIFEPAITISARGTIGFTKLRTEPFYPIVRLLVLIPKPEKATLQYLEYIINTINLKQFGSSIPQLSVPQLKNFEIPLPPLEKQKEIVEHLDKVFEGNKRLKESYEEKIASLREMKQSLLREAFEGRLVSE